MPRRMILNCLAAVILTLVAWPASAERTARMLDSHWVFRIGEIADGAVVDLDTKDWLKVTLPHTFNSGDGEDGGGDYYRGPSWYRRDIDLPNGPPGRRLFLQFDGAAVRTDVFVNGARVGGHDGAYARFRFDITDHLRPGRNVLAVRTDNAPSIGIAPLGGDFTVFGGLYRGVSLIATPALHVDLLDHGGPGVYARTTKLVVDRADIEATIRVRNDDAQPRNAVVKARIVDRDGRSIAIAEQTVLVAAHATSDVQQKLAIPRPRLWNGTADPYLYRLEAVISDAGGDETDVVATPLGVRAFAVDPERGFLLNGRPLALNGVNLFHSGRPGRGLAVGDPEIDEDFDILEAMGVTALRLVHFQHPQRAYDRADADGLVLWTEIPLNSKVDASPAFEANLLEQLRELIAQNYNHPSVFFWGLGNEIYQSDALSNRILERLQSEAKALDPSRLTVYAHCCGPDDAPHARHTDIIAYNKYFGWYPDQKGTIGEWADRAHALQPGRAMAVSEYGAGGSILHQQDAPQRPAPGGDWHPEQYQALFHEMSGRQLLARSYLWGRFVWVGFDLASDGRNEGDHAGFNDKGLVTYDRRTRKDAYYWYQAHWSKIPMAHITGRRLQSRPAGPTQVKVYSNVKRLGLAVNGRKLGVVNVQDGVAVWDAAPLKPGLNLVETWSDDAPAVRDSVTWNAEPSRRS